MIYSKTNLYLFLSVGCICSIIGPSRTHAAPPSPPPSTINQTDRILQHQLEQERRRQREEEREEQQCLRSPQVLGTTPPSEGVLEGAACVHIHIIVFRCSLLTEKQIVALKAPYLNTCMSVMDIKALMQDVTNEYLEMGYVSFPRALRGNRTVARLRRLSETSTWEFLPAGAREPEPMIVLPRHSPRK
uniref:POTRA domain-containing protein, ShlB-type n=1 Tax=Candidatus Kentrum sp. LPFa TaxID=2126335 RepID=A0A450WSQ4_9GAMM|nr:MAG: POTRA domain-containing protein, ShlB-type [Candidatus Kentron sp. LPFa]VFK34104.1 MAG: POTRA domain-containing protein, ShlB-type [Candidatus Kentron sp. LPFa]